MNWLLGVLGILVIGLFLYWQFVLAEGTYFGARLVTLLYDWTANRYNGIKEFNVDDEDFTLGQPLVNRLYAHPIATVLDVATGTGRVPLVLMRQSVFKGRVIGVDRSARMLAVAQQDTAKFGNRVLLIQADAQALPFATNRASMVTCLEALEFLPSPKKGLAEFVRVLQPGQWLLTTNRIGWEAKLMPGKTWSRHQLENILSNLPLKNIDIRVWQDIYDQVWAQKATTR